MKVSKVVRSNLPLMCSDITQHEDYSITLYTTKKMPVVDLNILLDALGKGGDSIVTFNKATIYRHVIGKILLIGRISVPIMLLNASMDPTKPADFLLHHLFAL